MKKFLAAGMLAICLIAASQQQASAWHKSQFSFGISWSHSSGGNSHCWGAHRNGQLPGPEAFGHAYAYPQQYGVAMSEQTVPAYVPPPVAYNPSPYQFATYPQTQPYYYPAPNYYYGR